MLESLKMRLFLMIGRGIVKAINNETKIMKVQVTGLKGETITDIERPQNYGFESFPDVADDLEAAIAYIGGNRDQGIVLVIHDRTNKPTDLVKGESRLYAKGGAKVTCKTTGIVEVNGSADFAVAFNDLKTGFDALKTDLNTFITVYNAHVHIGVTPGPGSTGTTPAVGTSSAASIDNAKVPTVKLP